MSFTQLRTANLGISKANLTGSTGVGFALINTDGTTQTPRTTVGVYQLSSGSGLYAANITFPDFWHGSVIWDTGEATGSLGFAVEQFNFEENDPRISNITGSLGVMSGQLQFVYDMTGGRWKLDSATNQMIFYASDNTTVVGRFNLFDVTGTPTINQVAERQRI